MLLDCPKPYEWTRFHESCFSVGMAVPKPKLCKVQPNTADGPLLSLEMPWGASNQLLDSQAREAGVHYTTDRIVAEEDPRNIHVHCRTRCNQLVQRLAIVGVIAAIRSKYSDRTYGQKVCSIWPIRINRWSSKDLFKPPMLRKLRLEWNLKTGAKWLLDAPTNFMASLFGWQTHFGW